MTSLMDVPCIEVDFNPPERMTVAEYDATTRLRENQPLWARRASAVEDLTEDPSGGWSGYIVDRVAYNAQMRALIGLQ